MGNLNLPESTATLQETLANLIEFGPHESLREFLLSQPAKDNRVKLSVVAKKWYKLASEGVWVSEKNYNSWKPNFPQYVSDYAFEALLLTASASELRNMKWQVGASFKLSLDLAECMEPDCLSACVESLLIDNPNMYRSVRTIVSAGLCAKPQIEQFAISVICLKMHHSNKDQAICELRLDPKTLEEDIWLLFETEGTSELSLAAIDKYSSPGNTWSDILYVLQKSGELSRERLLKCSLSALNRGFIQFRASWFSRFHESLNPTDNERIALIEDYGYLLASSIPPTVSFAISAWLKIDKVQPLSGDLLSKFLIPCLSSPSKSTVLSAISLIEKVCKRDTSFQPKGINMMLQALSHDSSEVQNKILKTLQGFKVKLDEEQKEIVLHQIGTISPTLQESFQTLVGVESKAQAQTINTGEDYQAKDNAWEVYHKGDPLTIIDNAQDFVDLTLSALESPFVPPLADSLMLAIALGKVEDLRNIANSKTETLIKKSSKPLIARLLKLEKRHALEYEKGPTFFLLHFLLFFFGANCVPQEEKNSPRQYFANLVKGRQQKVALSRATKHFEERLIGILERSNAGVFIRISFPTWDGGYVSVQDFLEQAAEASRSNCFFMECEPYLSVMRLPWSDHVETLAQLQSKNYRGLYTDQCRKALTELISVKNRYKEESPFSCDKSILSGIDQGKDELLGSMAEIAKIQSTNPEILQLAYYNYPIFSEWFHNEGAARCKQAVRNPETSDICKLVYFFPISIGIVPMKDRAHFLLAVGCLLSIPEIATMVSDCLISNIEQQKLNTESFGQYLGMLLHGEISMPKRVAAILGKVASISGLHNDAIRQSLQFAFARNPEDSPIGIHRDIGAILEILQICSVRSQKRIQIEATRGYLKSLKPGGNAGKIARALLDL